MTEPRSDLENVTLHNISFENTPLKCSATKRVAWGFSSLSSLLSLEQLSISRSLALTTLLISMATAVTTHTVPPQVVTQVPSTFVQVSPEGPHPATANKNVFTGLGITQIVIGVLLAIISGVALSPSVTGYSGYYAGYGIWTGAWFIAAGSLAIATGVRASSCNVIAGMVVAIIASIAAFGVGIAEGTLAGTVSYCYSWYYLCKNYDTFIGLHATLSFLCFVEFIVSIVHSSYCCKGSACCGSGNSQGRVMTSTTITTVPAMQTTIPIQQTYVHGQPQYYAQQPVMQGQQPVMQGQQPMMQGQQPQMYANYSNQPQPQQQPQQYAPPPPYNQNYQKHAM